MGDDLGTALPHSMVVFSIRIHIISQKQKQRPLLLMDILSGHCLCTVSIVPLGEGYMSYLDPFASICMFSECLTSKHWLNIAETSRIHFNFNSYLGWFIHQSRVFFFQATGSQDGFLCHGSGSAGSAQGATVGGFISFCFSLVIRDGRTHSK